MKSSLLSLIVLLVLSLYLVIFNDLEIDFFFFLCFVTTLLMIKESGDLLLQRRSIFDPSCFVAVFSYIFFFVSPLMQRHWQYWPSFPELAFYDDWLVVWILVNFFGAIVYRTFLEINHYRYPILRNNYYYAFDERKFYKLVFVFSIIGFVSQFYIYMKFGGVSGFVSTFNDRQTTIGIDDPFDGLGVEMLLADGFRNVFSIFYMVFFKKYKVSKEKWFFVFSIFILLAISFLFGGLKGSRGAIVYSVFWGIGMYHFWIKPIKIRFVIIGLFAGYIFLTTYYWYKFAGVEGISAIWDDSVKYSLNQGIREENGKFVLSRDLGRMDFQTITLKAVIDEDFPLSFGRSYISSVFSVIPTFIISKTDKLPSITKEKTELILGQGSYIHGDKRATTNLLGQFGELTVNFGVFGSIGFFLILAYSVCKVRRMIYTVHKNDVTLLLVPMLSLLIIQLMMYDSAVMLQFLMRNFIYIALLYFFCLRKLSLKVRL